MSPRTLLTGYGLLEGARWYDGKLVFSDMTRGGVFSLAEGSSHHEVVIAHRKGIGGLVAHRSGGLVVSGRNVSLKAGDPDGDRVLLETRPQEQFFNDLTADDAGRIYVGSVAKQRVASLAPETPGNLYRIDLDGGISTLTDDVLTSNGLGTSPDGLHLYHVDSYRHVVWDVGVGGAAAGSRRALAETAEYEGVPDGLAVATDGSVWVAMAGAGVVVSWDASGRRIAEIPVPQPLVTSVCFGGTGHGDLYILTGVNAQYPDPLGGAIYRTKATVVGLPSPYAAVRVVQRLG
jgi:gluconolactonase